MLKMTTSAWSDNDRDKVYTELCEAVTRVGEAKESLYLSRLCLLLVESIASRDTALRIMTEAEAGLTEETATGAVGYRI